MSGIQCAITVRPSERLHLSAKIKAWSPQMELDVTVWHPDLVDIMNVIENKLERGDVEAYAYNVSRWQRLVDSLTRQALLNVDRIIIQRMQQASSAISCLLLLSTLIYIRYPVCGITLDVIAILIVVFTYFFLRQRRQELTKFIAEQELTFKQRTLVFQQAYQASVADRDSHE